MERLPLTLDLDTLHALQAIAAAERDSVDGIIRDAISRDLARRRANQQGEAIDLRMISILHQRLSGDFLVAKSWDDLARRLRFKGYLVVETPNCLVLHTAQNNRICPLGDIGQDDVSLRRRFGPHGGTLSKGPRFARRELT